MNVLGPRAARWRGLAAAAAVLAVAALARLIRFREALWGPEVIALDGDSLYHFRRAMDVAAGRGLPTFDPQINWPYGGPVPWAPGFDLLGGAIAWLAGGPQSRAAALAVAALPVALGLLAVAAAMALARASARPEERGPAMVAAGLLAGLVPQAVFASRFAQTDHHVAEALLVILLALWTDRGVRGARRPWRFELAGAALAAGGVLFFTGAPIYVAIAAAPLLVATLVGPPRPLVGRGALGLVLGGAVAAVASIPLVASNGHPVSFAFPSYLQPALCALAGMGIAMAWLAARAGNLRRRGALLVLLCAVAAAAAALIPGLWRQVHDGVVGWLLARDPWLSQVNEFQAVWSPYVGPRRVLVLWGAAGLALPPLALAGAWLRRREAPGRAAALLFQALALTALAMLQTRFGRPAVPLLAAAGGAALAGLMAALAARVPVRRSLARALAPAVALAALLADPHVWRATADAALDKQDVIIGAALDLRSGDPRQPPGVVAPWDMGHELNVIGRRPVVANGFGSYLDAEGYAEAVRAYNLSEDELVAWMRRRELGYFVAGLLTFEGRVSTEGARFALTTGDTGGLELGYLQRLPLSAAILGGSGLPDRGVHHLTRLMPRYAALPVVEELDFPVPMLWTFERVEGARVHGRAPAGGRVVLEIPLVERGRRHVWKGWTDAAPDGRYELRIPLPTGYRQPTLATAPRARLRCGAREVEVAIPEATVRAGGEVVADLPPGP